MNSERLESEESLRSLGAEEADDEEEEEDEESFDQRQKLGYCVYGQFNSR